MADLIAAGYSIQSLNAGVVGAATADWQPGGGNFLNAVAMSAAAGGANVAEIMLGTNDAKTSGQVSASTYKSNLQAIIVGLFAQIPTLQHVLLHYQPYIVPNTQWDSTSDTALLAYQSEIDSLVNGTTILAGDKTAYSHFFANQSQLGDGTHPTAAGYVWLGGARATAFEAALPLQSLTLTLSGTATAGVPSILTLVASGLALTANTADYSLPGGGTVNGVVATADRSSAVLSATPAVVGTTAAVTFAKVTSNTINVAPRIMDALPISNDGVFDSGPQAVSTASTWQEVARLQLRGRHALASVVVGPQAIGGLKVTQSALPDDPAPVDAAVSAGLGTAPAAIVRYVVPAVTFPLAAGTVFQVSLDGEASEVTFWAQTAGAAGGTVQVRGTAAYRRDR